MKRPPESRVIAVIAGIGKPRGLDRPVVRSIFSELQPMTAITRDDGDDGDSGDLLQWLLATQTRTAVPMMIR